MVRSALLASLLVVIVAAAGCGDDDEGDKMDAATVDGGGGDGGGGDGGQCMPLNGVCGAGADCCSGRCEGLRCVPANCGAQGATCGAPGDCCSGMCGTDNKCASGIMCKVFGATCANNGECCSSNCANTAGGACAGTTGCSCAPTTGCKAAGDPCSADNQCCNGLCDRPGGATNGLCASVGSCRTAGEPCGLAGFNGACCSTICLTGPGDTVARCQFLGGCRVQDDLCAFDAECCSGACRADGTTLDGRPIKRCANAQSCLPVGEVCGGQGASSNCCPDGGGRTGCESTGAGFSRCLGGTPGCTLPAQACTTTTQCCRESFPNIMCQPSSVAGGMNRCCLADGQICAFGSLCCGGICAPSTMGGDPPGTLRCGTTCRPDTSACTTNSDCCNCCVNGMCTSSCGGCTGPQLGELCNPAGPTCCGAPTVACLGSEFPRCSLVP